MSKEQPEALRLADALEDDLADYGGQSLPRCAQDIADDAAAELRRLHAQRDALLEALKEAEFVMDDCPMVSQQLVAAIAKARAVIKAAEENT